MDGELRAFQWKTQLRKKNWASDYVRVFMFYLLLVKDGSFFKSKKSTCFSNGMTSELTGGEVLVNWKIFVSADFFLKVSKSREPPCKTLRFSKLHCGVKFK